MIVVLNAIVAMLSAPLDRRDYVDKHELVVQAISVTKRFMDVVGIVGLTSEIASQSEAVNRNIRIASNHTAASFDALIGGSVHNTKLVISLVWHPVEHHSTKAMITPSDKWDTNTNSEARKPHYSAIAQEVTSHLKVLGYALKDIDVALGIYFLFSRSREYDNLQSIETKMLLTLSAMTMVDERMGEHTTGLMPGTGVVIVWPITLSSYLAKNCSRVKNISRCIFSMIVYQVQMFDFLVAGVKESLRHRNVSTPSLSQSERFKIPVWNINYLSRYLRSTDTALPGFINGGMV